MEQSNSGVQFIDEVFMRHLEKEEAVILPEYIKQEMILKGYDPINKDDIREFWLSKGIEQNG